jgi:hypothetical protein
MRLSEDGLKMIVKTLQVSVWFAIFLPATMVFAEGASRTHLTGIGFFQMGKVEHSSDTLNNSAFNNYNGTWQQATGAMVVANTTISDNWSGAFGIGALQTHISRGARDKANLWYPFWAPFVSEANITYIQSASEGEGKWNLKLGAFPYNYNPDIKNLGLYLLRGYVYPGLPISGFETKPISGGASQFGALIGYSSETISNDLIINVETEDKPLYDVSIADIASWKPTPGIEFSAGFNLYRVIAQDKNVTSPDKSCNESRDFGIYSLENPKCYWVEEDTLTGTFDTTLVSLAGTKLMGRFHLDPKPILGLEDGFGPNDLIFYSEIAVLGVKDYKSKTRSIYGDLFQRMPVMFGFNIPTFGYVDFLNVEIEYYASKLYPDMGMAQVGSAVPRDVPFDNGRNDLKWSVYSSKVIASHVKLSGQVANDHLRLGGFHDLGTGAEALSTPKDWYWMAKLAFFF